MTNRAFLTKIARLYYIEDLSQRDIAKRLQVSAASVSRALSRARSEQIVQINVEPSVDSATELEIEIERRFGVRECNVVRAEDPQATRLETMAFAAADVLARVLHPGDYLGVSWGETLRGIAEYLPEMHMLRANVVPIVGAMGEVETGIYPNSIARAFASRLGGQAHIVNAPALLDSEEICRSIQSDRNFANVRDWWKKIHTAIVGISGIDPIESMYRYSIFSDKERNEIHRAGAVCVSNFNFLSADGRDLAMPLDNRMIKMPMSQLSSVRTLIGVAMGARKAEAIRALLARGVLHVLIMDEDAAEEILALDQLALS